MYTVESASEVMREHGQRVTPQKQLLFKVLQEFHGHPTAEELYEVAKEASPTLSLATVYSNLRSFVVLGLCKEVRVGSCVRFDKETRPHHHVVEEGSGKIEDVFLPEDVVVPVPEHLQDKVKRVSITYIT